MINWNQFTVDNGAITDLRELLFTTLYNDPDIDSVITNETGVRNGKKLGYIDSMGDVGEKGQGCKPAYSKVNVRGIQKEWELGDWEIAKEICYADLENTIAAETMKTGTDRADLQDTPYWDIVLMPLLERAVTEMFWRIVWFGNKEARNISDGGVITNSVSPNLFNMCDGLWTRVLDIIASNEQQHTVIAANSATAGGGNVTYASQKNALRAKGEAISIMDNLLSDSDSRIWDDPNSAVYMTSSLYRALRADISERYGNHTMPFEQVFSGIAMSEYDGHKLVVLDIWDRMIKKFEDSGTALNCPHRAIALSPKNIFVGTNDTDKVADLQIVFNQQERMNYIYCTSKIGTLIGEDALIHVAI